MRNKLAPILIAILFTIIFLHPVLSHFSTHLPSRADGVLISWLVYRVSTSLISATNIFQLPFFHPFSNTLAYSDPFFSTALLSIPLIPFTANIIAIHNIHLIVGSVVMYVSTYLLCKELKYTTLASHISAFLFSFSITHLHYVVHLQSFLLAGIPLVGYFLLKWKKSESWVWLAAAHIAFLYQTLNSPMSGFFLIFSILPLFVFNKRFRKMVKKYKILFSYYFAFSIIIIALFYLPYFEVSQSFSYVRSIRDTAHFAHSIEKLFSIDLLITYLVILLFWRSKDLVSKHNGYISMYQIAITICIGAILMLGPVLKIDGSTFKILNLPIPLPYAAMYYIIPGFKAFRDSSRWILVFNFGIALLVGKLVTNSKLPQKFQLLIFSVLATSFFFLNLQQLELHSIPIQVPTIYESVKESPQQIIAEFPVYSWRMMPYAYLENDRLLYQTYHNKKLYNGVSGFTPPIRETQWEWLWQEFPNENTIQYLKSEGVELIVVHYWLYEQMHQDNFSYANHQSTSPAQLKKEIDSQIQPIECVEESCVYSL